MISKESFEGWKELAATKEVFQVLLDFRQRMMESWADGQYDQQKILEAMSKCQAYQDFVDLNYGTVKEFYGVTE